MPTHTDKHNGLELSAFKLHHYVMCDCDSFGSDMCIIKQV